MVGETARCEWTAVYWLRIPVTFDWAKFFNLALDLDHQAKATTDPQLQEAQRRSAISRAYYACWCRARNTLKTQDDVLAVCLRGHSSVSDCLRDHGCVINYYLQSKDNSRRQIGDDLQRMMRARKQADYDDVVPNVKRLCDQQLLFAQDILALLNYR